MTNDTLPRHDNGLLQEYAWPGGYPLYYLDSENSVLCPECARVADMGEERESLPQFAPVAYGINWEDASLDCDECGERIESAYADDETTGKE